MDWSKILKRIKTGETRQTEFKRGLGDLPAVGKAICAFANTEGGVLIIGVDDTRRIIGVKEDADAVYMMVKGFMEQRGRGWPVMRRAMREFNGTEPEIVAEPTRVRVTFRLDPACAGSAFQASA